VGRQAQDVVFMCFRSCR